MNTNKINHFRLWPMSSLVSIYSARWMLWDLTPTPTCLLFSTTLIHFRDCFRKNVVFKISSSLLSPSGTPGSLALLVELECLSVLPLSTFSSVHSTNYTFTKVCSLSCRRASVKMRKNLNLFVLSYKNTSGLVCPRLALLSVPSGSRIVLTCFKHKER